MSATRVLRGLVLGALGGALGWLLPEMVFHLFLDPTPTNPVPNPESTLWGCGIVGAFIGAFLGVGEGILAGTRSKFQRAVLMGAGVSFIGGCVGVAAGNRIFDQLLAAAGIGPDMQPRSSPQFFALLLARTLGRALFGRSEERRVGEECRSGW